MIIEHYFKVHFVQKQAKRKFATFDENHGLTPFEKISTWRLCKIHIFSLGRLVFQLDGQQTLFQGPFCVKISKENSIF